jgi:hypothetical protein
LPQWWTELETETRVQGAAALEAARASLFDGIVDDGGLEQVMDWSPRTKERRIAEGLPFLKIGAQRYFVVESVRAWLLTHERSRVPRGRGRPRGRAA